jgi:transcription elongation factor SPT5
LHPQDDSGGPDGDGRSGKRKKPDVSGLGSGGPSASMRPPQCFFNYEEVIKVYSTKSVSKRNQVYVFQGDTYKDRFIEKDFRLSGLVLENVNPTLNEITWFTRRLDIGTDGTADSSNPNYHVDLSIRRLQSSHHPPPAQQPCRDW